MWEKFLNDQEIIAEQGWGIRHSTVEFPDYTYDSLQVINNNIFISYLIKDEVVDYILLGVIGEVIPKESFETAPSIYYLDTFEFYINGENIATMSGSDWVNVLGFEEAIRSFYDLSERNINPMDPQIECRTRMKGVELVLNHRPISQYNSSSWMGISMSPVSTLQGEYNSNSKDSFMDFSLTKDGSYSVSLYINDKCPLITSNYIMPGDNIKTFLNSYEEGLYEKIISLTDPSEPYYIGPYYFRYSKEDSSIFMGKSGEHGIGMVTIGFDNEIVTRVGCIYGGTVSGFEDEPLLW